MRFLGFFYKFAIWNFDILNNYSKKIHSCSYQSLFYINFVAQITSLFINPFVIVCCFEIGENGFSHVWILSCFFYIYSQISFECFSHVCVLFMYSQVSSEWLFSRMRFFYVFSNFLWMAFLPYAFFFLFPFRLITKLVYSL